MLLKLILTAVVVFLALAVIKHLTASPRSSVTKGRDTKDSETLIACSVCGRYVTRFEGCDCDSSPVP